MGFTLLRLSSYVDQSARSNRTSAESAKWRKLGVANQHRGDTKFIWPVFGRRGEREGREKLFTCITSRPKCLIKTPDTMAVLTLHSCYDQYEVACAADL